MSTKGMAEGGVINEHIIGRGQSGQMYEFGERGPERVTPMKGSRTASNITININGNVLNNHDQLARILIPAIRKAEYDGV
jgi:TfoX/Sxy family transcriptional regulator of competence genes